MDRIGQILDEARRCLQMGREEMALERLEPILEPFLARPWVLELWMRLVRDFRPQQWERMGGQLERWSEVMAEVRAEWDSWRQERDIQEDILSPTVARLYWKQGHRQRALKIFRELVRRRPDDRSLVEELRSLERAMASEDPSQSIRTLMERLEEWMKRLQERRRSVQSSSSQVLHSDPCENDT